MMVSSLAIITVSILHGCLAATVPAETTNLHQVAREVKFPAALPQHDKLLAHGQSTSSNGLGEGAEDGIGRKRRRKGKSKRNQASSLAGFVENARWIQGASKHLVPKVKGSLHNVAGVVSTAMNSSYTLPSWGDGLREEAQIRIQKPRDVAQKAWKFGAPIGVQSYPRSDPFASETADGSLMLYYVAGDWLRRVDAKLGKVTTLLNLVEAAGMKSFSSAVVNGTCKCWPKTDSVHQYECGTPKQVEDGKHPKICGGGVPTNTVTNI